MCFFVRSTGALAVTVRQAEVEQVFCTSQAGGAVTFADLTLAELAFVEVPLDQVRTLNPTVGWNSLRRYHRHDAGRLSEYSIQGIFCTWPEELLRVKFLVRQL